MAGYQPLKITGNSAGLVQERENFLLPDDAYPVLQNAYVWRERILRKKGYRLLGRLQRNLSTVAAGDVTYPGGLPPQTLTFNIFTSLGILANEPNASVVPGTVANPLVLVIGSETLTDTTGTGVFVVTGGGVISSATINYATGDVTIVIAIVFLTAALTVTMGYYPGLPVMGIRIEEATDSSADITIFFDQKYAYKFNQVTSLIEEFIPGTTWNAANLPVTGTNFFWSTNYWVSFTPTFTDPNLKLFWVTNGSGENSPDDPPRITNGIEWKSFNSGTWNQINGTPTYLRNFLAMLPFRGRMVTFNTWEGPLAGASINYSNRIRWATIGNPFIPYVNAAPPGIPFSTGSWRDDIRGQGGFLDIPTSEDIVAVGYVRDNLVVYCERSTWQLRYTGRSISPFQIERVNSELGVESTFAAIQFDTSLIGVGDKGVVECDSYKSERIDIKIPDFVFQFSNQNNGVARVQGIRDFPNRLAFWTIPLAGAYDGKILEESRIFPNIRLLYNYENDSWALLNDSLTALGNYQTQSSRTWLNTPVAWTQCDFTWIDEPRGFPAIMGGNQQGFIEQLDELTTNAVSLYISNIVGHGIAGPPTSGTATVITSPNHNMSSEFVIGISGIPTGTPYDNLNGGIFGIVLGDSTGADPANKFRLFKYDSTLFEFSDPQLDIPSGTYIGGGLINIRENFSIQSKKFNFLDEGQNIQLGYIDILMSSTGTPNSGAISLNVYLDYDDENPSNILPKNQINDGNSPVAPDLFFNATIPTTQSTLSNVKGTKFWQRVFCATRASFLTLEYTFSNAQMAGLEQQQEVQIDAQVLHIRKAGRMTSI